MKDLNRNNIRNVLVLCSDATRCADIAHTTAALCRAAGADLFLVSVIYNPFGVEGLSFPRPSLKGDYRRLVERTRSDMEQIISREKQLGIAVQGLIREGKPANELLDVVREKAIDLLVLPAQTQTRLESLLSGGFNKKMLRKLPCSVLFLKTEPVAVEEEVEREEGEEGEEMEAA